MGGISKKMEKITTTSLVYHYTSSYPHITNPNSSTLPSLSSLAPTVPKLSSLSFSLRRLFLFTLLPLEYSFFSDFLLGDVCFPNFFSSTRIFKPAQVRTFTTIPIDI